VYQRLPAVGIVRQPWVAERTEDTGQQDKHRSQKENT
jgi:hypothetical protein